MVIKNLVFFTFAVSRSTSVRTMSLISSRAGSPHMGTLNSHFTSGASSGSRTLERMPYDAHDRYLRSPDRNSSLTRSPYAAAGWDSQYRMMPPPTVDSWSLLRNGSSNANHRGKVHLHSVVLV